MELIKDKYTPILEIRVGSHLYGTNTENSDEDFSGIVLPTMEEIFGFEHMDEIDVGVKDKDVNGKNIRLRKK